MSNDPDGFKIPNYTGEYVYFVVETEHRFRGDTSEYRGQIVHDMDWLRVTPPIGGVFKTFEEAARYLKYVAALIKDTYKDDPTFMVRDSSPDCEFIFRCYDKTCKVEISKTLTICSEPIRYYIAKE